MSTLTEMLEELVRKIAREEAEKVQTRMIEYVNARAQGVTNYVDEVRNRVAALEESTNDRIMNLNDAINVIEKPGLELNNSDKSDIIDSLADVLSLNNQFINMVAREVQSYQDDDFMTEADVIGPLNDRVRIVIED